MCRLGNLRTDTLEIWNRSPKHKVEQQGQDEQSQGNRVQMTSHTSSKSAAGGACSLVDGVNCAPAHGDTDRHQTFS